jgi:hypothetical protein
MVTVCPGIGLSVEAVMSTPTPAGTPCACAVIEKSKEEKKKIVSKSTRFIDSILSY